MPGYLLVLHAFVWSEKPLIAFIWSEKSLIAFVWSEKTLLIAFVWSEIQITRHRLQKNSMIIEKYMLCHISNAVNMGQSRQFFVNQSEYVISAGKPITLHENSSDVSRFLPYPSTQSHKRKVRKIKVNGRRDCRITVPYYFLRFLVKIMSVA